MGESLQVGTMAVSETLTKFTCGCCGGVYAISERYREQRYKESNGWNCPYCRQSWGYYKGGLKQELEESKKQVERYARRLDAETARTREAAERAERTQRKLNATRGVVTKQRKTLDRVKNGVCPCCNRSFVNLQQHMKNQHPQYQPTGNHE